MGLTKRNGGETPSVGTPPFFFFSLLFLLLAAFQVQTAGVGEEGGEVGVPFGRQDLSGTFAVRGVKSV